MKSNENFYEFGISVLHAYIRTFELLLHISYKINLKEWQARGTEAKNIVQARKKEIAKQFYEEMGLVVDLPKQGGGNTNDGNTARKFFLNPEKSAEITALDIILIRRFSVILSCLSSGYEINTFKFKQYCIETATLYVKLYDWFPMSPTVHKVLIHSAAIDERMILPIGQLSEDVQESRQKDWKTIRLQHTRKTSRVNTNTDILNRLLVTSDPIITHSRKRPRKRSQPFSQDVLELLQAPSHTQLASPDEEQVSSDSDLSD